MPDRPAVTTDFANIAISDGTPESRPAWSTANNVVANDTQEGSVLQLNAGVNFDVGMRGWLPVGSGQTFRTFLRAKSFGGNQGVDRRVFIANGSGAYLGVLQFGGTLSQNWQTYTADFTSEQVKAAQPNAAYVRFGFWNGGGQYAQQYARVGLQNVTSEVASAASASASASSASSAATSKNGADTAAAAANQSKLDAQGASSAASGSASAAAGSAAAASGSASSAQQFATLAAYSGSNAANPNPTFTAYANPNGTPDGWQVDQYNGGYHSRASLPNGGYAWRQEVGASNYMLSAIAVGSPSNPSINLDEYWVMEGEVVLEAGTLQGSTIWMRVFNADGEYDDQYYINFAADTDNSGNVPGAGSAGRTYFYNKLVRIRRVNGKYPTHFWLYASSNGSFWGLGAGDYKKMLFKKVAARRANEQEVLAKTAIPSLTASVSSNSASLTTLQGRALAYWQQIAGVTTGNGASAFVELRAEGTYGAGAASTVAMGAREIHLYNQAANGTYSKALSVVTGRVTVYGDLDVGGAMRIGTRRIPIALQSFLVQGSDGQAVSFGADLTNIPKIEPQTGNLPALPSGQSYDIKALGLTSTGFTTRAKIITQGQSSAQNSGAGVASGGTPYYKAHKPSAGDAVDGNYTFSVNGNIQMYVYGGHQQQVIDQDGGGYANLQADCYVKRNGNWQYIGSLSTSISSYGGGSSGMQTFGYYMSGALYCADSIGQDGGGDYEFGMDVYTDNGNITSVNFSGVTYQAQGQQSGETAVSQPITFRVLPQNA